MHTHFRAIARPEQLRLAATLDAHVEVVGEDWIYRGARNHNGYAIMSIGGKRVGRAHRIAYEIAHGPIPAGLHVDHVQLRGCKSRACVRPEHLEAVPQKVNNQRAAAYRRAMRAAGVVSLSAALTVGPALAAAASDQFTLDERGVTLPGGDHFEANEHVNIRYVVDGVTHTAGVHLDPNDGQPGGQWIGSASIPWGAFGIDVSGGFCAEWVQVAGFDYHFGEQGEGAYCEPDTSAPESTPEPTPTSEPSPVPSQTPAATPAPSPTVTAAGPQGVPLSPSPSVTGAPHHTEVLAETGPGYGWLALAMIAALALLFGAVLMTSPRVAASTRGEQR